MNPRDAIIRSLNIIDGMKLTDAEKLAAVRKLLHDAEIEIKRPMDSASRAHGCIRPEALEGTHDTELMR